MRRTTRYLAALLLAAGLAAAAPQAAASPWSPLGVVDDVARSLKSWWVTVTGDHVGQRAFGASDSEPTLDPADEDSTTNLDPDGTQTSAPTDDDSDVAPHLDPNG